MQTNLLEGIEAAAVPAEAAFELGRFGRLAQRWSRPIVMSQAIADQAVVSGTGFATAVIIGRSCTTEQLGLYYLTLSIVVLVSGIQDNLVALPYTIYSKRYQDGGVAPYLGNTWLQHFVLTAAVACVLLLTMSLLWIYGATEMMIIAGVLIWASPLVMLRDGVRRFLLADLHFGRALAVDGTAAAVQLGGLLLLAHYGRLSLATIFGAVALAAVLSATWYAAQLRRVRFAGNGFVGDWRQNWSFARWSLRSYLVGSTMPYVLPWLLNSIAGTAATGIYGACATLVGVCSIFVSGVSNLLSPLAAQAFVHGGKRELIPLLVRAGSFLAIVLGSVSLAMVLFGQWLAVAVFGERFLDSGAVLGMLAISASINSLGMTVGIGLCAIDNPRANFLADVTCAAATLLAAALLIPAAGVFGAAVATLLGVVAGVIARVLIFWRVLAAHDQEFESAEIPK